MDDEIGREITIVCTKYVWLCRNGCAYLHVKPRLCRSERKNRKAWKNLWNKTHVAYIKVDDEGRFKAGFDHWTSGIDHLNLPPFHVDAPKQVFDTITEAEKWIVERIRKRKQAAISLRVYMRTPNAKGE